MIKGKNINRFKEKINSIYKNSIIIGMLSLLKSNIYKIAVKSHWKCYEMSGEMLDKFVKM